MGVGGVEPGLGRGEGPVLGGLAGLAGGAVVAGLMAYQGMTDGAGLFVLAAAVAGVVLGQGFGYRRGGVAAAFSGGLLLGLPSWAVWFLTVAPVLHGEFPSWSAVAGAGAFRELVGLVLAGGVTGLVFQGLAAGRVQYGRRVVEAAPEPPRVVIVGGGFAGVAAARRFEQLVSRGRRIDVTLVSDSNFLLFTPMLAGVAGGSLEGRHISTPIRAAAPRVRFVKGQVTAVDPGIRRLALRGGRVLEYDHLILAVGAVPHFFGLPGIAEHSFTLKSLADADRVRHHVLALLEEADGESDPGRRRALLTFVVAGGGFAGTELVAEFFDLVHGVLHYYPGIHPDEPRFVLVHSGERILPELSAELGAYALERLTARGVEFLLGKRVARATADSVVLTDGTEIVTHTLAWTAGNRPNPLVAGLPAVRDKSGRLVVDSSFRVAGPPGLWAVGDCAQIPDPDGGGTYPPTAQHALREGRVVADNVAAVLDGRVPRPFRFRTLGVLVALGHRTAAAEIKGRRFSGVAAWLAWRGIYLSKLPGLEKRFRVLVDWAIDLAFPRDIAVTAPAHAEPALPGPHSPSARPDSVRESR